MISIKTSDRDTFEEIKKDNEHALASLFEKHYVPLCRYAYTYLKDEAESENLIQEVFINIWNKRSEINIRTSVSSYLYRSAKNSAINFLTKNSRHQTESIDNLKGLEISNEDSEIDENEFSEMERKLSEALKSLPDKCKKIFIMSRVESLKYREIAEQLNISIKTVETQMSVAIKKIKEYCMA
jgi:RNA polymerase sigma-70 factor (ECF subfamily)